MANFIKFKCVYCRNPTKKPSGAVNRARKIGSPLYCDRKCAGLGRRNGKTTEQKKAEKAAYDRQLRANYGDEIRSKKRAAFARDYDPVVAAVYRASRMDIHVAYCQRPEYVIWKRNYDKQYRANRVYGPFAEAFLVLLDVENEIATRATNYEIRTMNETLNKTQKRKRQYAQATGDTEGYR